MLRRGLSARLERHVERGEELMELNHTALELNRGALELNRSAFDRNTQAFERVMAALDRHMAVLDRHEQLFEESRGTVGDLKVFIRETNRRSEKVIEEMLRRNAEFNEEESRRTDQIVARLDDAREESKAHREALLTLIDRLPPAQAA